MATARKEKRKNERQREKRKKKKKSGVKKKKENARGWSKAEGELKNGARQPLSLESNPADPPKCTNQTSDPQANAPREADEPLPHKVCAPLDRQLTHRVLKPVSLSAGPLRAQITYRPVGLVDSSSVGFQN